MLHFLQHRILIVLFFIAIIGESYGQEEISVDDLMEMSLEDLLRVEVTTASNKTELLDKAPATIIVITAEEIQERGYFELYDVLNDLPGFDLSRAFGDDNYYAYVRGYRKTTSDQMLLMIDGIIMNHLYNNNMNAYAQYPLQNIKQIEVVYGPASAIYGPNAFTGVINMITKKGEKSVVQATSGQNNTNLIDLYFSGNAESVMINLSGRLYQSEGPDLEGRTSRLEDELYTNPYFWGEFSQTDFTGYKSPIESNYLHANLEYNGLTLGAINSFYESGLGAEFAGGTALNSGTWQFKENSVYARFEKTIDNLSSKTLIRYRRSDIPGSSAFLWRWLTQGVDTVVIAPGNTMTQHGLNIPNTGTTDDVYVVDLNLQYAEYWQANNASYSFFQDFTYSRSDHLTLNFGLKYNRRILNRDYVINTTEVVNPIVYRIEDYTLESNGEDALTLPALGSIDFPDRPDDSTLDQDNHNVLIDRGIYIQGQYSPSKKLTAFAGLRYDHNSVWKEVLSPRIGVVFEPTDGLVTKVFYGTAFLEPSARILYGGWQGSLSNDQLVPEKMRTLELSGTYTNNNFSFGLNSFLNTAPDAIGQGANRVPINLGKRRMFGVEANAKYLSRSDAKLFSKFRGDLYVSYITSEEDLDDSGDFNETGNMAPIKVKLILTSYIKDQLSVSLQNRYVSEINTVSSNPLGTIDAFFVSDLFINYSNLPIKGLSLGIKVYNLLDSDYFHPGYREADAGESGTTHALLNTSWYNSRLPQPKRTFLFNFRYEF